jgi:hypothetical protein
MEQMAGIIVELLEWCNSDYGEWRDGLSSHFIWRLTQCPVRFIALYPAFFQVELLFK